MEKNIKIIIISVIIFFLLLIASIIFFSNKEKYFEFISYEENGMPYGVEEFPELDGNQRYYKVIYSGQKAISVSYHDYDGTLKDFAPRTALIELEYNDNDELIRMIYYDMSHEKTKVEKIKPQSKTLKKKKKAANTK